MKGTIVHYRQNRHSTKGNHMIISVEGVESRDAAQDLVGKEVAYNTGKSDIKGKIASAHGNKGAVRAIFEKGMPGQAISKKVTLN